MKKIFAIGLAAALSLTVLAGCGETENNNNEDNTKPSITGVQDTASITAGTEFDALAGVSATDKEDGDVTNKITIESVPSLTFTDGKATPTETGDYELIYTVKDSGGLEGNAYCTLSVTPAASEAKVLYSLKFDDVTAAEADYHYWTAQIDEAAEATATLKQGAYVFDVTHLNKVADDKVMLTRSFADLGAGEYEFVIWAKSSVATKINMNALLEGEDNWDKKNLGGGKYNEEVGTTVKAISHKFTLAQDNATVLFRVCLGGDDRPDAFSFAIEKTAIYKTTGSDNETELYKQDFAENATTVTTQAGDGAAATVAHENGAAKVNIASYHNAGVGGVWSLKVDVALGNAVIEKDTRYGYSIDVTAKNAQAGELLVENASAATRANFSEFSIAAGEKKTITNFFNPDATITSEAVLRFQIGNASEGVTNNELTIDNVRLFKIEGNLKTETVAQDKFVLFGNGSSNAKNPAYPINMENGSDGGANVKGIGTAYIENGKLVYQIHEGGEADYQSKLAIGYWDNPLELPGNAYYTFRIKMKASAQLTFNLFVHNIDLDWDPGLIIKRATYDDNGVTVGTTETELEFKTTEPSIGSGKFEFLLQFGSPALSALGEVTIEITEFTVSVNTLA